MDKDGRKMSKSSGNALTVDDILKNHGAEVTRWWVGSLSYENDIKVDASFFTEAGDLYRKIRNTFAILLSNLNDFDLDLNDCLARAQSFPENTIDHYVLSLLGPSKKTHSNTTRIINLEMPMPPFTTFCNDTLSSFYLSSIKDRSCTVMRLIQNDVFERKLRFELFWKY